MINDFVSTKVKICTECSKSLPYNLYGRHPIGKFGLQAKCRACYAAYQAQRRTTDNYCATEHTKVAYWSSIKRNYGISQEIYEQILKEQNEVCAICKQHETVKRILSVDHCHSTNKVRGLLCDKCNNMLGKANDSIEILKEAIKYLERNYEY